MESQAVISELERIATSFAQDTVGRQKRRELDPADFEQIKAAGFLMTGVPEEQGGLWRGLSGSARSYSMMVRTLAHGDPSVALVSAMHPAVITFFLSVPEVDDAQEAWVQQRQWVIDSAKEDWWGTVTSEPGSGGDILRTKTAAKHKDGNTFLLSGDKHFGSGSGHARYMVTTGKCEDADLPDLFWVETRDEPWDGSTGCHMIVPWDGMGMSATQSHAFRFTDFPSTRAVTREVLIRCAASSSAMSNMLFTGVVLGVADNALAFAKQKVGGKLDTMRPYEVTEWTRCRNELWLAEQAYQGALRSIESESETMQADAMHAKVACAELIETALSRMSKVVGGASYSKAMPLAQWTEDVKALGFLRPPMPLAFDQLTALINTDTPG